MHWVVQDNTHFREPGYVDLMDQLKRLNVSHSIHKVIPFVGELEPEAVIPEGMPVFCFGSYSMWRVAEKNDWLPGVFKMDHAQFIPQRNAWGDNLLNFDAAVISFGDFDPTPSDFFFIRPYFDSKVFAGTTMTGSEFLEWKRKVLDLREDDGSTISSDTKLLIAKPKRIKSEYRFWVVDEKIVTWSQYKSGSMVLYKQNVDQDVISFATAMAGDRISLDHWAPAIAFVMDVCRTEDDQLKIVEAQCINASGLYAADCQKLVAAIEDLTRHYE